MRIYWVVGTLVAAVGCTQEGTDTDPDGGGVIDYTVDGTEYSESTAVSASLQPGFLAITWNSTSGGDLGEDFYGSLTLSAFDSAGTYAPVQRMSDVDAVIEVAADEGTWTFYPRSEGREPDGSIVVESVDEAGASGTFSFTGVQYDDETHEVAISGSFTVTFPAGEDG